MAKRIALYLRVSTGEQTTMNQRIELGAWAERAGHTVVEIYEDAGISGAKGRDQRPALDRMLKDAARRKFDQVAVWAVDRLGRSLTDLVTTLSELKGNKVDVFMHAQGIDTATSAGRALYGMLGVFSEFEREMIVARVRSGIARAQSHGTKSGLAIGRQPVKPRKIAIARDALAGGSSVRAAALAAGISVGKAQALRAEMHAITAAASLSPPP